MLLGIPREVRSVRRLAAAATAAAMMAWGAAAPAATYTWVGGTSTDYNNPSNWSPTGVPGAGDVANFNVLSANQPVVTAGSTPVGELKFNTSGWQLGGGPNVLQLNGLGGVGILNSATSGTNKIGAYLDVFAPQTWEVANGGTLQIDGQISDSQQLTIGAAGFGGTVLLTNSNPFSGALNVNAGTLELGGATVNGTQQYGTLLNVPVLTLNGGTFQVNNTTAAGGNQNNRLSANTTVDFFGGSFVYIGSDVAGTASSDSVGAINLNPGPIPVMTVNLPAGNSTGSAALTVGPITQFQPGSTSFPDLYSGTLLMNGTNLGLTGGGMILSSTPPSLVGTTAPAAGAESPGTLNLKIVPFLLGESGLASGQGGTATGTPNTFLTYNSTTGFRPLNPAAEFASAIGDGSNTPDTTGDNIYLTSSQSALNSTSESINSLVFNGTGSGTAPVVLTIPDGLTLSVASGSVLFVTSGGIQNVFGTSTNFDLGAANANITVLSGATATISTNVTGSGTPGTSMSVTGGGTLVFNGAMTAPDGITAANATVTFNNGWNPSATSIYPFNAFDNSTFNFNGSSEIPGSSDSQSAHVYMTTSTVNVNGTLTFDNTSGSSNYQDWHLDNSTINVGNSTTTPAAILAANGNSGMIIAGLYGGNGAINVYPNATFTVPNGLLRFGSDSAGQDALNVSTGGAAILNSMVMGDNGGATAAPGTLGAIFLQPGSTFNITSSIAPDTQAYPSKPTSGTNTNYSVITGPASGIFSVGAAGDGTPPALTSNPNRTSTANALLNDFGYVSVPTGASIGPMPSGGVYSVMNVPGEIDIGGAFRGGSAVGGGNGLMDVNGGTVTVNTFLTLADSSSDQQFGVLNILNGGIVTINAYGQEKQTTSAGVQTTTSGVYIGGSSNLAMSTSAYGSYAVLNVINSTLNNGIGTTTGGQGTATGLGPFPNNAINLAGPINASNLLVSGLPTGILNLVGPNALVQTSYIQARPVSFNVTTGTGSNATDFSGEPSAFVNFNGGTLQINTLNSSNQTGMIAQTVAGAYVYSGGAVLSGGGATGGTETMLVGLFAPPGQGVPMVTLTVGNGGITNPGSGYTTPPIVEIGDGTGFDATGYATINATGQITGVTITNPGFNLTNPTITFVGGGGNGAAAVLPALSPNNSGPLVIKGGSATFNLTGNFASTAGNGGGGGTKLSDGVTTGQELYSFNSDGTLAPNGSGLGNNPYASGTFYGNNYPGVRNNTSTFTGPTIIETGALQLTTANSSSVSQTGGAAFYAANAFAALNNNIPFSSSIIVGDTSGHSGASFNVTTIGGAGGFELSPGLINGVTYNANTYSYTSTPQVLAGFGTVVGNATHGLTVGLASGSVTAFPYTNATTVVTTSTGNNFGGYPYAATGSYSAAPTVNHSVVSPGYTASGIAVSLMNNTSQFQPSNATYGAIVVGSSGGTPTVTFNTKQGSAAGLAASQATGALTITGLPTGGATTTFGAGGTYYWKLDLTNGGVATTNQPGTAQVSPGTTAGAPAPGAFWDQMNLDTLAVSSTIGASTSTGTTNAFTIEGVGFNGTAATGGSPVIASGTTPYSWVIARVGQSYSALNPAQLLASLSFDTTNLPRPASGYQYFLSAQQDPGNAAASDLVVSYAPVPEPTGLALFAAGAGLLVTRRRRKSQSDAQV